MNDEQEARLVPCDAYDAVDLVRRRIAERRQTRDGAAGQAMSETLRERIAAEIFAAEDEHAVSENGYSVHPGYPLADQPDETREMYLQRAGRILALLAAPERHQVMPGVFECAKCGLVLVASTLHVQSGDMSADGSPQGCANGCGPMWPLTYKKAYQQLLGRADRAAPEREATEDGARLDWRAIETAPKDGRSILVRCDRPVFNIALASWCDGRFYDAEDRFMEPTHWMPLPAPPESDPTHD